MARMTPAETAWVAGIIEGEGYIGLNGGRYPMIQVDMTDEDVVSRLHEVTGIGRLSVKSWQPEGHKTVYRWVASKGSEVAALLETLRPWLGSRRNARIDEVLATYESKVVNRTCRNGHERTPENLWTNTDGHKCCRLCRRDRERRKRAA